MTTPRTSPYIDPFNSGLIRDFDHLPTEEQARLTNRMTTLDYGDLTAEEQALLRERLRHGPFCGYPPQMWLGATGPTRLGDLELPAFSTPADAFSKPMKDRDDDGIPWFLMGEAKPQDRDQDQDQDQEPKNRLLGWLKGLFGRW